MQWQSSGDRVMVKHLIDDAPISDRASELVDLIALASLETLLETCIMSQSDPINEPAELGKDIEALRRVIRLYKEDNDG